MPSKGRRQYDNPVRAAIERTTGRANAGTRAAASSRIVNNSELRRAVAPRNYSLVTANEFYDRMGVSSRKRRNARILRTNSTRVVHRADRKDPNTGFGMNVRQYNRYKIRTSGS